jgi:Rieske 2Fe-2S family protein
MARWPKPAEGSWTKHFDLDTAPISYSDSISPEFYELEREAIFKTSWLNVGRVEQLPRKGSYFTKEIQITNNSVIIVRSGEGDSGVRAFHNVCRHRGNKLVWDDFPREETAGTCRQFTCKYHAWRYNLDGSLNYVQQEGEFFDLDKKDFGLAPVHCEVWAGFIFINLAEEPEQSLHDFLGPMVTDLEGYPFDQLTERYSYRAEIGANWKLYMDAFAEFYHAPILHAGQTTKAYATAMAQLGFEAPHYQVDGPHRLVSTAGIRAQDMPDEMRRPMEDATRSGLFGPWDKPEIEWVDPPGLNPARCDPWGLDSFQLFPNTVLLIWGTGWYLTYRYWPTAHNKHVFEGDIYFVPPRNARERIAQEMAAVTFKEYALQDANTLEATQMSLESRAVTEFALNDQEVLVRHLHKVVADKVDDYLRRSRVKVEAP